MKTVKFAYNLDPDEVAHNDSTSPALKEIISQSD